MDDWDDSGSWLRRLLRMLVAAALVTVVGYGVWAGYRSMGGGSPNQALTPLSFATTTTTTETRTTERRTDPAVMTPSSSVVAGVSPDTSSGPADTITGEPSDRAENRRPGSATAALPDADQASAGPVPEPEVATGTTVAAGGAEPEPPSASTTLPNVSSPDPSTTRPVTTPTTTPTTSPTTSPTSQPSTPPPTTTRPATSTTAEPATTSPTTTAPASTSPATTSPAPTTTAPPATTPPRGLCVAPGLNIICDLLDP